MAASALTESDKDEAASRLEYWLGTDEAARGSFRRYVDSSFPGCEKLYLSLKTGAPVEHDEVDDGRLPRLLVDMAGIELFEGGGGKKLRSMILDAVRAKDSWTIKRLSGAKDGGWGGEAAGRALGRLRQKRWRPGGSWARRFVRELGFPPQFSGIPSPPEPENVEIAEKRPPLGTLKDFQLNLKSQLAEAIDGGGRCILRLPTGAGKTRIAAEAIVDYWKRRPGGIRWALWIADKEELCEQAVQCFKQLWEEKGAGGEEFRIHRVWGRRGMPDPFDRGIVVAGIGKLHEYTKGERGRAPGRLGRVGEELGLVVVDEAHHAVSRTYRKVLASLGLPRRAGAPGGAPLVGLTATPFRTAEGETGSLLRRFNRNVLAPDPRHEPVGRFNGQWKEWDHVVDELTRRGVLSRPTFRPLETSASFRMSERESDYESGMSQLPSSLLDKVGMDTQRNMAVFEAISGEADAGKTVLFFGTNVNQALMMSKVLNDRGITSAAVTGGTRYGARSEYVNSFREGRIRVLCNYQVLTTGFDAPRTDSVIIARPTSSRILYEQMVGRGLRGSKFGGTDECTITTVLDNIRNHEHGRIRMGYEKYIESSGIMAEGDKDSMRSAVRKMES